MALFNRSFKKHIQDELKFRKTFHGAQNVLTPHVRVTSLVEGKLTDSLGHVVDFKNTIIIMTSNIGTQAISSSNIGFAC